MTLAKFLAWTVFSVALFAAGHHSVHVRSDGKALAASSHPVTSTAAAADRCMVVAGAV